MIKICLFLACFSIVGISISLARTSIVAAQPLLADLVSEIAGDSADVSCLLTANADPHTYEPTPSDLRRLVQADVVVINGLGLEPWADRLIEHSGFHGVLVTASEGCPRRLHLASSEGVAAYSTSEYDPHAWHDPENVIHYVIVIRDALKKAIPDQSHQLDSRSADYISKIEALNRFAHAQLATIAPDQRKLVTSHDSLQYLAKTYDLKIVPIAGSRPDQEPSARELAQLISFIRAQHVRAIFFEPTSSPQLAQLVATEAQVKVVRELCTDGLGLPGTPSATYLGMFRTNIETIVAALR